MNERIPLIKAIKKLVHPEFKFQFGALVETLTIKNIKNELTKIEFKKDLYIESIDGKGTIVKWMIPRMEFNAAIRKDKPRVYANTLKDLWIDEREGIKDDQYAIELYRDFDDDEKDTIFLKIGVRQKVHQVLIDGILIHGISLQDKENQYYGANAIQLKYALPKRTPYVYVTLCVSFDP